MSNNCNRFNQFYYGDHKNPSCFNNNVGQEYICPQVGEGGLQTQQLGSWFAKERQGMEHTGCHCLSSNIGRHTLCETKQTGGNRVKKVNRPMQHQSHQQHMLHRHQPHVLRQQQQQQVLRQQRGGAESEFSIVNPGGSVPREYVQEAPTGDPLVYDLSALGYEVKMPEQSLSKDTMSFFGYGRMGCPWNPTCPCGADCPCGPSCTCGQENSESKSNLGDVAVDLDSSSANEGGAQVQSRQDIAGNYHKVTGEKCSDKPAEEYVCDFKCDEDERGCPINIRACAGSEQVNYRFLCKDRLRCGNGPVASQPNKCCQNCNFGTQRILNNPYNPDRQYDFAQPEQVPNYYFDLTQPSIGNRPVFVKSNREKIPEILLCDTVQNQDKCFGCRQPCWNERCL